MQTQIILVEDHDSVRRSMGRALTLSGIAVWSFECAEELLEIPNDEIKADCLLIDIGLQGMSGVDLCNALRERGVHIPVICMSADHSAARQAAARSSGAVAYLLKPFEIGVLLEILDRVVLASRRA